MHHVTLIAYHRIESERIFVWCVFVCFDVSPTRRLLLERILITIERYPFRRSSIGTFIRSHPSSESSASSQSNKPKKEAPPKLDYRSMVSIDDMPALFVSFDSKLKVAIWQLFGGRLCVTLLWCRLTLFCQRTDDHPQAFRASSFSSFALFSFRWMRKML